MYFNSANDRLAVVDANSHPWTSVYDNRGSVIGMQDSLGAWTSYQYDPANNQVLRIDARNWPTTYSYEALNRVTKRAYINSTIDTFTFDAAGQQTTIHDTIGNTSYTYDNAGRKTSAINGITSIDYNKTSQRFTE